jgi:hypothetical protein
MMTNRLNSSEWEALNAAYQLVQDLWLGEDQALDHGVDQFVRRQQFVQFDRAMQKIREWHRGESGIAQGEGSGGAVQAGGSNSTHRGTRKGLEGNVIRGKAGVD